MHLVTNTIMEIISKIVCCILTILLVGGVDVGGMLCANKSSFNCGAKFPQGGNTCSGKGCCCDGKHGTGMQVSTCGNNDGLTNHGCKSCWGNAACAKVVFELKPFVITRSLASCGDNHDGTSIMEEVTDIVSQFPAFHHLKDTSKTLVLGSDGKQTFWLVGRIPTK